MTHTYAEHEPHFNPKIGGYLREAVFGFNDGLVSTFAVIAGLYGGAISNSTILLAALATLVGGAFSMGLGTYLGNKSERDLYFSEMAREKREMRDMPEAERQEVRDIYAAKGFKGKQLEDIVRVITSDNELWLDTMMRDELGFGDPPEHPIKFGITMSASFTIGSFIATAPFLFDSEPKNLFFISGTISLAALITVGWLKTYFTKKNPFMSIFETLSIGALAAGGAYVVGLFLT